MGVCRRGWGARLGALLLLLSFSWGCSRQKSGSTEADSPAPAAATGASAVARSALLPEAAKREPVNLQTGVRYLGRVVRDSQGATYAWSGSGFAVRFRGTGLVATLVDSGNLHSVIVDGVRVRSLATLRGQREYILAGDLPPGEHVVRLERRTEAFLGPTSLVSLAVAGGRALEPPSKKPRLLEVIGDSISCGYGNLGQDPSCPFSPETEDHYLSYGRLLAGRLNADLSTVAWSGRGVVKNYDGEVAALLPALYGRALPEDEDSHWDFPRPADYVVVNLGTNDFSTEPDPAEAQFSLAYEGLLETIRKKNPQALIVATIGPMLVGEDRVRAQSAIDRAVRARVGAGDENVRRHELQANNRDPGCHYHPGLATHRAMAEELRRALTDD